MEVGRAVIEVARVHGHQAVARLLVGHEGLEVLAAVGSADRRVALVHSTDGGVLMQLDDHIARLRGAGVTVLNFHRSDWEAVGEAEAIGRVHEAGLRALAWDTQTESDARQMLEAGADGVYADDPAVLVAAALAAFGDGSEQAPASTG